MQTFPASRPDDRRRQLERRLRALEDRGDLQAIVRIVEAWEQEGTVSLVGGLCQARAFLDLRLMDRAWVRLRSLAQAFPEDPEVMALTAQVFIERGWPARARKVLDGLRAVAPEHPQLQPLTERSAQPAAAPPPDAREIERRGDVTELLALAESYLATGSFLRARSILERVRRQAPLNQRVELLLWGLQGDFLPRGSTLADLLAESGPEHDWEGHDNTESFARADLGQADPPTAEVTRAMLVEAGMIEAGGGERFPSLFRRVKATGLPGGEDEEEVTVSSGLATPDQLRDAPVEDRTDPGTGGSGEDLGGDTQIMQVIPGPGGGRLGEVDGPIHRESDADTGTQLRETLDLRAWQQSMGMGVADDPPVDDDFLEAEDEDLVVMTRREEPAAPDDPPPAPTRQGPIEVIEKHPTPPPPPAVEAVAPQLPRDPGTDEEAETVARLVESTRPGRRWFRLFAAILLMAGVMGGATALILQYLHDVVAGNEIEDAQRALAAGDYRGLLQLEARLDKEVRAQVEPLGARAVSLAVVEAVLWGEYTGNPDQRSRALEAIEIARQEGAAASDVALAEGTLALLSGDLQRAARSASVAGIQTEAGRHLSARVALARGDAAAGLALWRAGDAQAAVGIRHRLLREALLRESGDQQAAAAEAAALLQAAGDNPLVAVARVIRGWEGGDPLERISAIEDLLEARRDDLAPRQLAALYGARAQLLDQTGQHVSALDSWRRAASVDATHPVALYHLGAASLADNRVLDALADLQSCVRFNPSDAGCQRGLVQVLLELDRIHEARELIASSAGKPRDASRLGAWVAVQNDELDVAKPVLVELVEADASVQDGLSLYLLGLSLAAEEGGERNADRSLELAVASLRNSTDAYDRLLVDRARAARVTVAEASDVPGLVRAALASGEGDPMVHVHIADRYERMGRRSAAAQHLATATRVGPESALAWYALGQFYFAPATMNDAMTAWRQYLELSPTGTRAERTRSRFP